MQSIVLPFTIIAAFFGWTTLLMGHIYSVMGCTFTVDNSNITYNFAPIAEMGQILALDQDSTDLTYYFQICANLNSNHNCTDYDPGIGCAQQWTDGQCTHWLAEWDNNDAIIGLANASDPFGGLSVEFDNGEMCYSEFDRVYPYKSKFLFLCDESTDLKVPRAYLNPHDKCMYEFPLLSKYACTFTPLESTFEPSLPPNQQSHYPTYSPTHEQNEITNTNMAPTGISGDSKSGCSNSTNNCNLSAGLIVLIVFLVLIVVIVFTYCGYKIGIKKQKENDKKILSLELINDSQHNVQTQENIYVDDNK